MGSATTVPTTQQMAMFRSAAGSASIAPRKPNVRCTAVLRPGRQRWSAAKTRDVNDPPAACYFDTGGINEMIMCRNVLGAAIVLACGTFGSEVCAADEPDVSTAPKPVDATTLRHKVMCGYQGWFRAPNDGTDDGWHHWSRNRTRLAADALTVEMWPDTSEYTDEEKYP